MYVLAIKCRGENNICQRWSKNNLQDGNIFAQSKNRIFAMLPDDDHKSRKDKRVGDRKGIKASTAGYVAPCQWTRCWNAGWTLGSVTQNNCRAGSLPPNGLTAQREKKRDIALLWWLSVWRKMTPALKLVAWALNRKESRREEEKQCAHTLAKHTSCVRNAPRSKMVCYCPRQVARKCAMCTINARFSAINLHSSR